MSWPVWDRCTPIRRTGPGNWWSSTTSRPTARQRPWPQRWPDVRLVRLPENMRLCGGQQRRHPRHTGRTGPAAQQRHAGRRPDSSRRCAARSRRRRRRRRRARGWSTAAGRQELSFGVMMSPLGETRQKLRGRLLTDGPTPCAGAIAADMRPAPVRRLGQRRLPARHGATAAEQVGLLDERYFMYCEDVDFCAVAAGCRTSHPVRPRGGRHPPARPVARVGAGRHQPPLPGQPGRVLPQAPPEVGSPAALVPRGPRHHRPHLVAAAAVVRRIARHSQHCRHSACASRWLAHGGVDSPRCAWRWTSGSCGTTASARTSATSSRRSPAWTRQRVRPDQPAGGSRVHPDTRPEHPRRHQHGWQLLAARAVHHPVDRAPRARGRLPCAALRAAAAAVAAPRW